VDRGADASRKNCGSISNDAGGGTIVRIGGMTTPAPAPIAEDLRWGGKNRLFLVPVLIVVSLGLAILGLELTGSIKG
jgi:hypothetical protein